MIEAIYSLFYAFIRGGHAKRDKIYLFYLFISEKIKMIK